MIGFILITLGLFILANLFPLTSFLLPVYGIKRIKEGKKKEIFLKNIMVILLLLLLFDYGVVLYYVIIYFGAEMFFLFFEKKKIGEYEKIHITSLIFTIIVYGYIIFNITEFNHILEEIKELYVSKLDLSEKILIETINYVKKYAILVIYIFLGFMNFMIYIILKYKTYVNWKINYYYLIPYVIFFLLEKVYKFDNIFVINGIIILKIPYILYGIKELYKVLKKYIKSKNIVTILLILFAIIIPEGIFILGGIRSFKIFEEVFEDGSNIEGKC